jgi:hypothetical protein
VEIWLVPALRALLEHTATKRVLLAARAFQVGTVRLVLQFVPFVLLVHSVLRILRSVRTVWQLPLVQVQPLYVSNVQQVRLQPALDLLPALCAQ